MTRHIDSAYARCAAILQRLRNERLRSLTAAERQRIRNGSKPMPRIMVSQLRGAEYAHFRTLGLRLYEKSNNQGCCAKKLCELNANYEIECHDDQDRKRLVQRALGYTRARLAREVAA